MFKKEPSQPEGTKKTLVYCSEGSPEGFNPQLFTTGTTFSASSNALYNRLLEFEIGTTQLAPALAESYVVDQSGLVYTFKLRHGVKFHTTDTFTPTRDFNADDVVFSFNRQRLSDHPYAKVSGGTYQYFNDMGLKSLIKDVVKIDDYTVQFILTRPESPFLADLGMDFASIFSEEYGTQLLAKGTPEQMDLQPVGTGPFQLVSYQKDAFIRYKAHSLYWKGKEKIEHLIFSITVDPAVRFAKLRTGECHVMAYPLPSQLEAMHADPNLEVQEQPGLNIAYWAFHTQKKPFDNLLVRKALNLAVNKQAIIEAVYNQHATAAKNFIPPNIWSYNDEVVDYEYNPEKAKELLKQAGYPNGFEMNIWAMPVQRPYNPNARKMAELIQQDLKTIGVKAEIVTYEWGTYVSKIQNGEHETVLIGWVTDNGDPDNFFSPLLSCAAAVPPGSNYAFWCHKDFDALIQKARQTSDLGERTKLYKEAQLLMKEEVPLMTIAHGTLYQAKRKEVEGLKLHPFGTIYFSGVSLAE
ncbi:MAG: ABC transporter substrate-binding protein [Gammaproteobacteria bacterium]|nr:ABC transporter substrate-binding protein [Gammaproteobacteria bacterium]